MITKFKIFEGEDYKAKLISEIKDIMLYSYYIYYSSEYLYIDDETVPIVNETEKTQSYIEIFSIINVSIQTIDIENGDDIDTQLEEYENLNIDVLEKIIKLLKHGQETGEVKPITVAKACVEFNDEKNYREVDFDFILYLIDNDYSWENDGYHDFLHFLDLKNPEYREILKEKYPEKYKKHQVLRKQKDFNL